MDSFRTWLEEQGKEQAFCAEYDRLYAEYEASQKAAAREMTLEEAFAGLDEMLRKLEDSSLPLEEALELYQRGTRLLAKCNDKIDLAEKQILMVNEEGGFDEFEL